MQNIKNIREKEGVSIILQKDLEFELLVRETRAKYLQEEKTNRDIFNQEDIALENAAHYGDGEVAHTNGRVIQNNKARHNKFDTEHKEKDSLGLKAFAEALAQIGISAAVVQGWISNIGATIASSARSTASALKGTFDDNAQDNLKIVMDENFIYGGENVSMRTANVLNKRIGRILDLQKQMEEASDPVERAEIAQRFETLVERTARQGLLYHPDVGWSYSTDYVQALDQAIAERYDHDCNEGVVCTFSPIARASHNGRKMKIDVGDQYDNNPDETIGKVEVKTPQIVAPPEYKFVR